MNQIFRIVLLIIFAAASCSKEVIDDNDLPVILADIYLTDRYLLNSPVNIQKADSLFIYEPILNKYGYTTEDLVHTLDYYLPRPQKLKNYFIDAKAILEKRELNVRNEITNFEIKESILTPIRKIIEERDSLKEIDSYQRSVGWIIAPDKFPQWRINLPDSLKTRFELPKLEQWWLNNLTTKRKSPLYYEKNRRTIHLPDKLSANPERLSLPSR